MTAHFIYRLAATVFCVVFLVGCDRDSRPVPPVPKPNEDPITRVSVPGAYGVPGGDQSLNSQRQKSALFYDNSFAFRLLEPSSRTVVSLSGLPASLQEGDRISVYYRVAKGGKTLESELYENVEILMISDKMAWLKKSDQIFFVVPLLNTL